MDEQQSVLVFTAALQGICANEYFFGPTMQNSPEAAVAFAYRCVKACCRESDGAIDFSASRFPAEEMSETLEARAKETESKANAHASLTEAVRVLTEALEPFASDKFANPQTGSGFGPPPEDHHRLFFELGLAEYRPIDVTFGALRRARAALTTAKELTK